MGSVYMNGEKISKKPGRPKKKNADSTKDNILQRVGWIVLDGECLEGIMIGGSFLPMGTEKTLGNAALDWKYSCYHLNKVDVNNNKRYRWRWINQDIPLYVINITTVYIKYFSWLFIRILGK